MIWAAVLFRVTVSTIALSRNKFREKGLVTAPRPGGPAPVHMPSGIHGNGLGTREAPLGQGCVPPVHRGPSHLQAARCAFQSSSVPGLVSR